MERLLADERRQLTTNTLKSIAILTMTLDHIGFGFYSYLPTSVYYILRGIGRIAFPIFCFMIAEGMYHTSSRLRYCSRLFIFAVLSEIPYDLLGRNVLFNFSEQNVLFTLLAGALTIWGMEALSGKGRHLSLLSFFLLFACCTIVTLCNTDYRYFGILYIVIFYFLRRNRAVMFGTFASVVTFSVIQNTIMFGSTPFYFIGFLAILSILPLSCYYGKKGARSFFLKYWFYFYYPLHMLALYFIRLSLK